MKFLKYGYLEITLYRSRKHHVCQTANYDILACIISLSMKMLKHFCSFWDFDQVINLGNTHLASIRDVSVNKTGDCCSSNERGHDWRDAYNIHIFALSLFRHSFAFIIYQLYMTNTKHLDEYWVNYLKDFKIIENDEERLKRLLF